MRSVPERPAADRRRAGSVRSSALVTPALWPILAAMDLAANLSSIREKIRVACERAGRAPEAVSLVAVSKNQPPEHVRAVAELGLSVFGENRVQEARAKIGQCPGRLHWHLIGHLQSNKCRDAVHFFEMIQSVDSLALAEEVNKWADKTAKTMPILLEVNIAGEGSKFGYRPAALLAELAQINALRKLEIHGLMTVAPWTLEPEKVRPVFQQLRDLKIECEQILGAPLAHLSMGMSGDYEIAIEEGATMIRVGTALFGPRSARATAPTGG
jgi:pyridoxal phosphate enzyme (YggS family)